MSSSDYEELYSRVVVGKYANGQNMVINHRTEAMIWMVHQRLPFTLTMVQGSYHGTTAASAGTHDGGGVIDFRTYNLTSSQREQALKIAREEGFYAWHRTVAQGFAADHMHWVAKGDAELSPEAKKQASDAEAGYNGLVSHQKDNLNLNVPLFNYEEYLVALLEDRVVVLEGQVGPNTDARAQYAYSAVIEGGNIDKRLDTLEARVQATTDARAQYAYSAVIEGGSTDVRLDDCYSKIETLEATIEDLKAQVAALTGGVTPPKP